MGHYYGNRRAVFFGTRWGLTLGMIVATLPPQRSCVVNNYAGEHDNYYHQHTCGPSH